MNVSPKRRRRSKTTTYYGVSVQSICVVCSADNHTDLNRFNLFFITHTDEHTDKTCHVCDFTMFTFQKIFIKFRIFIIFLSTIDRGHPTHRVFWPILVQFNLYWFAHPAHAIFVEILGVTQSTENVLICLACETTIMAIDSIFHFLAFQSTLVLSSGIKLTSMLKKKKKKTKRM